MSFLAFIGQKTMGQKFETESFELVKKLPDNFPVLVILSGSDNIVPRKYTEIIFKDAKHINLSQQLIVGADHLMGLRVDKKLYKQTVEDFLRN